MKVAGIISQSELTKCDRIDASFLLLLQECKPVVEELEARFTREQLLELAEKLPYDRKIAEVITQHNRGSHAEFMSWLKRREGKLSRRRDLVVYVAAALQYALSKMLTEVLELSKHKKAKLQDIEKIALVINANKGNDYSAVAAAWCRSSKGDANAKKSE